jgi:hypothetical protein
VTLHGLDRLTELRRLRISCMPAPSPGFASDALWRIVVPTSLTQLRCDLGFVARIEELMSTCLHLACGRPNIFMADTGVGCAPPFQC